MVIIKMEKQQKIKRFKPILAMIMVLTIVMLMTISMVSAYDKIATTKIDNKYKEITIKDKGVDEAKFTLISNTEQCGGASLCSALIKVEVVGKVKKDMFESIIFKNVKDGKDKTLTYTITQGTTTNNLTAYSKTKDYSGTFYIYITASKSSKEVVDWIPTFYGLEVNEWAIWGVGYTYDDLANGVINWSLFSNVTNGGGSGSYYDLGISGGKVVANCYSYGAQPQRVSCQELSLSSTNLTNINSINNITFRAYLSSSYSYLATITESLIVFGNTIRYMVNQVSDETYNIKRNYSYSGNVFDVYNSTSFISQIIASNNVIKITGSAGGDTGTATAYLYPIYYTLSNNSLGINMISPLSNATTKYSNLNSLAFNVSTNTTLNQLSNITLYIDGVNNNYTTISGTTNNTLFIHNITSLGTHNYTYYSCDSDSNCKYSELRYFEMVAFYINSFVYNATTYETNLENFIVNISYDSTLYNSVVATLIYNGTSYPSIRTGTAGNTMFTSSVIVPMINNPTQVNNFYWSFLLIKPVGTETQTSASNSQTVTKGTVMVTGTGCSAGFLPAMNFTFSDEESLLPLNANVSYYFTYGLANSSSYTLYGNQTNVKSFVICINATQGYYNLGYGEVQYQTTSYTERRFYAFTNTRITNNTTNIILYELLSAYSTSFLVTAQTTSLIPYKSYYIGLLRWYPATNQYISVEMSKTDDLGKSVLHVKTEDVDYRLALYAPDGTLVQLLKPIRMICQTIPCTYSMSVEPSPLAMTEYTDIQSSLTWDPVLKKFTFIWNDPSQASQNMNLTVWKRAGTSSNVVCSTTATGYTGIITCDASASSGLLEAQVTRTASPAVVFTSLFAEIRSTIISAGGGAIGLFIGAVLLIFFALIGTVSPVLVVILGIISLIPLFLIGSIQWAMLTAIAVIGGVILHFLSRINK